MPDDYHAHEALHVVHVLQNMVAHELEGHPFVVARPDIAQQVELVQRELGKLYQAIGAIHLGVMAHHGGQPCENSGQGSSGDLLAGASGKLGCTRSAAIGIGTTGSAEDGATHGVARLDPNQPTEP